MKEIPQKSLKARKNLRRIRKNGSQEAAGTVNKRKIEKKGKK